MPPVESREDGEEEEEESDQELEEREESVDREEQDPNVSRLFCFHSYSLWGILISCLTESLTLHAACFPLSPFGEEPDGELVPLLL